MKIPAAGDWGFNYAAFPGCVTLRGRKLKAISLTPTALVSGANRCAKNQPPNLPKIKYLYHIKSHRLRGGSNHSRNGWVNESEIVTNFNCKIFRWESLKAHVEISGVLAGRLNQIRGYNGPSGRLRQLGENASFDKETVERLTDIQKMDEGTNSVLFNVIDTYIQNFKTKKAFAK